MRTAKVLPAVMLLCGACAHQCGKRCTLRGIRRCSHEPACPWLKLKQVNKFEEDDVYRIVVTDKDEEE